MSSLPSVRSYDSNIVKSPSPSGLQYDFAIKSRKRVLRNSVSRGSLPRAYVSLIKNCHTVSLSGDQNPEWRSRLKKDPGIPNLFPYKDKILHEIEEKRRLREEEYAKKREDGRRSREDPVEAQKSPAGEEVRGEDALSDLVDDESMNEDDQGGSNPMSALLASARARAGEFENDLDNDSDDEMHEDDPGLDTAFLNAQSTSTPKTLDQSRRAYDKIYKTVLSNSDIILYVLDARDPNGTRSREIEQEIVLGESGSKRLILILNKIDLVPSAVLQGWLSHLRRSFPTLPLRASTPAPNARTFDHKALTVKGTSETLLRALKSYAQSKNLKRSATVGIIGYPNVGKSSVINALTSRLGGSRSAATAAPVGSEAGVTTALREVKLDNKLKLLDSPGIVFPASFPSPSPSSSTTELASHPPHLTPKQASQAHLILLSALPPSAIDDPVPAITLLLHRLALSPAMLNSLLEYYNIPPSTLIGENGDVTADFLVQVARRRGRLGKGGVPNLTAAAMNVLVDWRDGRIAGWIEAPAEQSRVAEEGDVAGKAIVKEWGKEFKLEGLWGDDTVQEQQGVPLAAQEMEQ